LREYRYFLVRGSDEIDAAKNALIIAERKQHSYQNQFNATVRWKLEKIIDIKEIFDFKIEEGLELYHEYIEWNPASGEAS